MLKSKYFVDCTYKLENGIPYLYTKSHSQVIADRQYCLFNTITHKDEN